MNHIELLTRRAEALTTLIEFTPSQTRDEAGNIVHTKRNMRWRARDAWKDVAAFLDDYEGYKPLRDEIAAALKRT